jgi:hypothetical protein
MTLMTLCFYRHGEDEWWIKYPDGRELTSGISKEDAWSEFRHTITLQHEEQLPMMREAFDLCPVGAVVVVQDESRIFAIVVDPDKRRPPAERLPWIWGLINSYLISAMRLAGKEMADMIGGSIDALKPQVDLSEIDENPRW